MRRSAAPESPKRRRSEASIPNGTKGRCCWGCASRDRTCRRLRSRTISGTMSPNGGCPTRSCSSTACRTPPPASCSRPRSATSIATMRCKAPDHHKFTSRRYRKAMNSLGRIALPTDRAEAVSAPAPVRALIHIAADVVDSLAAEWTALAECAAEPNAFAEHWFVAASLRTIGRGRDIRLIEVRRGARLIGLLPVEIAAGYARLPIRFVRNWCHDQAFLGTPLVAAGEERAFWAAAVAALDAADWAPGLLHLRRLAEGGPVHRGADGAAVVHRRLRAFLDSDLGSTAYYEQAVRSKKRKELRRQRNRLAELGRLETRLLVDRGELDAWCDAFLALEQAGWK